jgi:hypothetical protein
VRQLLHRLEMDLETGIFFEEKGGGGAEVLHELAGPRFRRRGGLSSKGFQLLMEEQRRRLERNIVILRGKQADFNRRMEEYIQSIRALIVSLGKPEEEPPGPLAASEGEGRGPGTRVRCLGCGEEKVFPLLVVVAAGGPAPGGLPAGGFAASNGAAGSAGGPAAAGSAGELIVDEEGTLKKGCFSCPRCGNEHLSVRDHGP